jgi:hypothetical protein
MKHTAYMLYNDPTDRHYEKVDISESKKEFTHNGLPYVIREHASFLFKRGKLVTKFKILPMLQKEYERRSYYETGTPEPIHWSRPEPGGSGDEMSFSAEDLYNTAVEKTSWVDLFRIGGGRSSYMGWLLIAIIVVVGIVGIIFILPMITGAQIIPGVG